MIMNSDEIIVEQFLQDYSKEAARALEKFEPEHLGEFLNNTSTELLLKVIPFMNPQIILKVYGIMREEKLIQLFESMEVQNAEFSIRMMNESLSETILTKLSSEKSIHIKRLLKYMRNSVGSFIDPTVFTLTEKLTVKEALVQTKKRKTGIDPILFILTPERKLAGYILLADLISEDPANEIRLFMKTKMATISPETPYKSLLSHPGWADHYCLPVVDKSSTFLGVIRLETIRSILFKSDQRMEDQNQAVINALGELYQIGLVSLLRSATDLKQEQSKV